MHCDVCGFRRELWSDEQLESTLIAAPHLAGHVLRGAPDEHAASIQELLSPIEVLPREGVDAAAVHTAMHALHLAGRRRHASTVTAEGVVAQLNTSGGGVPKLPVPRIVVSFGGVEGDQQEDRRNHGRPWQALCLWSAEVIEGLQAEGHPIGFGSAGENLTLRGLDWGSLSPGVELQVGTTVLQVTSYATPCAKNAHWFSDGGFQRMSREVRPAGSRLYAAVLEEGEVSAGDTVVVEPHRGR